MPRVTITVPEKNAQPYRFQLDRQVVTLGRGSENDIAIDCGSVSVKHAEMHRIEGGYELRDVGSTNGTKLDDVRQQVIPLKNGANVKLGDVAFDFLLSAEESDTLSREQRTVMLPPMREPEVEPVRKDSVAARIAEQRAAYAAPRPSGVGFGAILMFLILAACAFFAGLAIRYQKDTGDSLIEALQKKYAVEKVIEVPRPETDAVEPSEE